MEQVETWGQKAGNRASSDMVPTLLQQGCIITSTSMGGVCERTRQKPFYSSRVHTTAFVFCFLLKIKSLHIYSDAERCYLRFWSMLNCFFLLVQSLLWAVCFSPVAHFFKWLMATSSLSVSLEPQHKEECSSVKCLTQKLKSQGSLGSKFEKN